jgi:hypothetical protein
MERRRCFDLRGSGLRGRRTLEEGGPYVVVRCNNVVLAWLIRDACLDRFEEEEDGDKEEEGRGLMVRRMGKDKEQHGDEGCEEREKFNSADFRGQGHRWIECIARPDLSLNTKAGPPPSHPSEQRPLAGDPGSAKGEGRQAKKEQQ